MKSETVKPVALPETAGETLRQVHTALIAARMLSGLSVEDRAKLIDDADNVMGMLRNVAGDALTSLTMLAFDLWGFPACADILGMEPGEREIIGELLEEYKDRRCNTCAYREDVPGSAHSSCSCPAALPLVVGNLHLLVSMMASRNAEDLSEMTQGAIVFDRSGMKGQWVHWPWDFDPTWLRRCAFWKAKEDASYDGEGVDGEDPADT